jgi:GTPase KRas protein
MRSGQAFVLTYSITSRTSFDEIGTFREQILRVQDSETVPMVLVATKVDLENDRQVTAAEGRALAESWNVPFFETSSYTRQNVDECFFETVRTIRRAMSPTKSSKKSGKSKRCSIL